MKTLRGPRNMMRGYGYGYGYLEMGMKTRKTNQVRMKIWIREWSCVGPSEVSWDLWYLCSIHFPERMQVPTVLRMASSRRRYGATTPPRARKFSSLPTAQILRRPVVDSTFSIYREGWHARPGPDSEHLRCHLQEVCRMTAAFCTRRCKQVTMVGGWNLRLC